MQIYTAEQMDAIPWPPNEPSNDTLRTLLREGTRPLMSNVAAEVRALAVDRQLLPLVIVDDEPPQPNAYVCSPTTHYIDYAQREIMLEMAKQPLLRRIFPPILQALRPLMRWSQVERCVYVNNWLLSTNLYPSLSAQTLATITRGLLEAFPSHTIVFRSLNPALNGLEMAALEALGFEPVFSRQVYLLDPRDGSFRRRNNYGNDRRLRQRSPYRWRTGPELPPESAGRLCELYADLYLRKYSIYNPQFTPHYLQQALAGSWMQIGALEQGGQIDGVLGFIEQYGIITAPLVGYDRSRSEQTGLYRLLMLALFEAAAERGRMLHLSSGAASFKRLRGAEPQIEYSLVYHRHLTPRRRLPWRLLRWLSGRLVIPLMQHYQL